MIQDMTARGKVGVNMEIGDKPKRRLYRSRDHRMIAGVVGGVAEYFSIDATILRVIVVVASLMLPPMLVIDLVLYFALVFVIPVEPDAV